MFIFLASNRVRSGRLDEERRRAPGWVEFIEQHEPQLLAFHEFLNAEGTEVEYVQVHPNAESFEHHLSVLEDAAVSYQSTLEGTTSIRIYGEPTQAILEKLRRAVGDEVPIVVLATHLAGFTRWSATT